MVSVDVIILKEGTRIDSFIQGLKVSKACCCAVVLLRAEGHNVIVDPGAMGYAEEVASKLEETGVGLSEIDSVINTHMHLDHIYNDYLFPQAVIYTPTSVWHPEDGNRVVMYPEVNDPPIPGVRFLSTPGHMEKHISVLVESRGRRVVIAGDAIRESIIAEGRIPPKYPSSRQYVESMKRIFDNADEIIPGHGPVIEGEKLKALKAKLASIKA
jgi:N-acyl homoserine lactone hydrolase